MKITRIQAPPKPPERQRTAAYARVSDGKDAMLHSLSAQVSYYSAMIQRNPEWVYAGTYADEALTGTKDARPEFQRLLADCRAGKIDAVITNAVIMRGQFSPTRIQASSAANNDYFTVSIISFKVNSFTPPCSYSFASNSPVNMVFEKM